MCELGFKRLQKNAEVINVVFSNAGNRGPVCLSASAYNAQAYCHVLK
jgi:hypothetical protein